MCAPAEHTVAEDSSLYACSTHSTDAPAPEPRKARLVQGRDGKPLSPIMFEFCPDYNAPESVGSFNSFEPFPTPGPDPGPDPTNLIRTYERELVDAAKTLAAKRLPVDFDYTTLYRPFLHAMAQIGHYGAVKYGRDNWMLSPWTNDKSPQNHLEGHLTELAHGKPHDHFHTLRHQIAAIGFNAMMMFYWMEQEEREEQEERKERRQDVSTDDLRGAR